MAKDGAIPQRMAGSKRIVRLTQGRGNMMKFVDVPASMSEEFLEELAGLEWTNPHPLAGTVHFVENLTGNSFNVTIFQNDLKDYIAKAYAQWSMGSRYLHYADDKTKAKVKAIKTRA